MRFGKLKKARRQMQQKIEGIEQRREGCRAEARVAAANFVSFYSNLVNGTVKELNEQHAGVHSLLDGLEPVMVADWDDAAWNGAGPAAQPEIMSAVRIGRLSDPVAAKINATFDAPYLVPLVGAPGALILECDASSLDRTRALIRSLILRIAVGVPRASFTLLDPLGLGGAFPMRGDLGKVRPSSRRPTDELNAVLDEIRRINEDMLRDGDSFHVLDSSRRRSEYFEFVVAADYPHAYESDLGALEALLRIGNSGVRAGRYLILERRVDKPAPRGVENQEFENATVIDMREPMLWGLPLEPDGPPPGELQRSLLAALKVAKSQEDAAGTWDELVRPAELWQESSAQRIETDIGDDLKVRFGVDDAGQECSHGVLAGQTGSGKSYLLHVLITGLAARYSPEELRLILVDGKHGVTFQAYADLPHADVISLNSSPELSRSVLADFLAEMQRRYEVFQRAGVQSLSQHREASADAPMPRMLLVVDEYQQLVEGDSGEGAQMLAKVAEKGRAAGMHMLLGSQFFQAANMPSNIFNHMHLRIAMQLSPDYVQGLTLFGAQGKRLIRDLDQQGLAVVNHASGKDGANKRAAVAHQATAMRDAAIEGIVAMVGADASRPVLIDGKDSAILADNPHIARWARGAPDAEELEATARRSERDGGFGDPAFAWAERPLPLWLGRKFDVHGHACITLRRRPNENLVVVGAETALRGALLANSLVGLAAMLSPRDVEIEIVDGLHAGLPGAGYLAAAAKFLADRGYRARVASSHEAAEIVVQAAADLRVREGAAVSQPSRLLVFSSPETLAELHVPQDMFGSAPDGPVADMRELIKSGPAAGVHLIVAAANVDQLGLLIQTRRELRYFSHRVCQQLSEDDSVNLLQGHAGARIQEQAGHATAALYVDIARGAKSGVLFKSYAVDRDPFVANLDTLGAGFERAYATSV